MEWNGERKKERKKLNNFCLKNCESFSYENYENFSNDSSTNDLSTRNEWNDLKSFHDFRMKNSRRFSYENHSQFFRQK